MSFRGNIAFMKFALNIYVHVLYIYADFYVFSYLESKSIFINEITKED